MRLLKRKIKLAQTDEAFQAQAEKFLIDNGFEVNDNFKALFGSFVQMLSQHEDEFDPEFVAKSIRKAIANEFAFYLIHPNKRPVKDEPKEVSGIKS